MSINIRINALIKQIICLVVVSPSRLRLGGYIKIIFIKVIKTKKLIRYHAFEDRTCRTLNDIIKIKYSEKFVILYGTSLKSHHFVNSLYFHMSIFRPGGLERDYELPKILHHITTIEPYQLERIPITYNTYNTY